MTIYNFDITDTVSIGDVVDLVYDIMYYGSLLGGDLYFSKRLRSDDWELAAPNDKLKALYEATSIIETLNFRGYKADDDQALQFPRGTDTEVPEAIVAACYEISILLLGGLDPQIETQNQNVKQLKFGPITTEYSDTKIVPPHVSAGIFSAKAWRLLYPFIRQNTVVDLIRV